jgi:hypothetical protein
MSTCDANIAMSEEPDLLLEDLGDDKKETNEALTNKNSH